MVFLLHVITHGFHHMGQIVAMLRLLGYPAPDADMQRSRAELAVPLSQKISPLIVANPTLK